MNATQTTSNESLPMQQARAVAVQLAAQFGYADIVSEDGLSTIAYLERLINAMKQGGVVPRDIIERLRRIKRLLTHTIVVDAERKCTLYTSGMFGIRKIEVRKVLVERGPYAQYQNAVHVTYLEKGKRVPRRMSEGYQAYFLVLEGWGHPAPDGMWDEAKSETHGDVTVRVGRYSGCDPRWESDFDAKIDAYIAQGKARVLADIRHVSAEER